MTLAFPISHQGAEHDPTENHRYSIAVSRSGYVPPGRAWIRAYSPEGEELILPDHEVPEAEVLARVEEMFTFDDGLPDRVEVILPDNTPPAF